MLVIANHWRKTGKSEDFSVLQKHWRVANIQSAVQFWISCSVLTFWGCRANEVHAAVWWLVKHAIFKYFSHPGPFCQSHRAPAMFAVEIASAASPAASDRVVLIPHTGIWLQQAGFTVQICKIHQRETGGKKSHRGTNSAIHRQCVDTRTDIVNKQIQIIWHKAYMVHSNHNSLTSHDLFVNWVDVWKAWQSPGNVLFIQGERRKLRKPSFFI